MEHIIEETNEQDKIPEDQESSRPNGRPKRELSEGERNLARDMASFGCSQKLIAQRLDMDPKTLRRLCQRELSEGAIDANNQVISSLFHMATRRYNTAAAIFWAKTRCAWRPGGEPYENAPDAGPAKKPSGSAKDEEEYKPLPNGKAFEINVYNNDGEPNFRI